MKSLGDMDLGKQFGMDSDTYRDGTGTTSTVDDAPTPCKLCGTYDGYCNGSGFYDLDVPVGHPDFSTVFRCPNNPLSEDDQRKQTLRKLSNLGAFSAASFDNFDLNRGAMSESAYQSLRRAYSEAIRYADATGGNWMVIEGAYGSGKTHLAAAIGNRRLERGELVLFVTAPDLLDHLRGGYAPNAEESYDQMFDRVRRADLLILDDLGVENPSEWSREKLFQLLNHRYTQQLATVVTTNVSVDSLDPRLRSRMLDMSRVSYVRITAPDYRSIHTNAQERLSDLHLYDAYSLENFDVRHGAHPQEQQNLTRALQTAHEFVQGGRGWLVLIGNSGTGKTHLAAGVANHWQRSGGEVMFVAAPDLLDYLRKTFGAGSNVTFDEQFQQVKEAPLLVLDDLGAVDHNKAWVREKLLQIIKHRYIRKLPTVITTTQEFDEIDGQIRTRMLDSRLCHIFAITARPYVDRMRSR